MNAIAIFLLFVGMFLMVQGYYDRKSECPAPKVEVKFIPRSVYEDQLTPEQSVSRQFQSMFESTTPYRAIS